MTQEQLNAINVFSNQLKDKLNSMAENNPYDRVGLLQAVIALQCLTINYQVAGVLNTIKDRNVADNAENIANGGK